MNMRESAENYLETIYMLSRRAAGVRAIDIVNELEFTRPSVSVAMRNLRESGYIEVAQDGMITLTEEGLRVARTMYERHTLISRWLIALGVDEKTALEDACRMEHVISAESFEAIKKHICNDV
ncbi:MAG: metal-dependent transcriptional regulator [Clostridiales bacterium]|jgi:Mn-dependent DtxR family transcriptional regulator|nr:metal-dependent transcriptional regulator [Clostridiales bacterium]